MLHDKVFFFPFKQSSALKLYGQQLTAIATSCACFRASLKSLCHHCYDGGCQLTDRIFIKLTFDEQNARFHRDDDMTSHNGFWYRHMMSESSC